MAKGQENLISIADRPQAEQDAIHLAGGIARGKQIQEEAKFKKLLKTALEQPSTKIEGLTNAEAMVIGIIKKGSEKAFEVVRDTIGEKPKDISEVNNTGDITLTDEDRELLKNVASRLK